MHNFKLIILDNGGNIYYSDTDSLVTDLNLAKLTEILPNKIGNKLGQLKLEYLVKKAYFISNKTYLLLTEDCKIIKKAKGVSSDSLSISDYETMYLDSKSVTGIKTYGITSHSKGSVTIKSQKVVIDWNSYKKREKIYIKDMWINTKPLYINTLTKAIVIYNQV